MEIERSMREATQVRIEIIVDTLERLVRMAEDLAGEIKGLNEKLAEIHEGGQPAPQRDERQEITDEETGIDDTERA